MNSGFATSPLYADDTVEKTSRDRCSTGIATFSPYSAAILEAIPPMPPSGPSTAPENRDTQAISALSGSDRQSIFETSPARLSSIDSPRFVGALRYFTRRPTSSENGRQMTGNIHGFAVTKSFCQRSLVTSVYTISQASTETAPIDGHDDDVDVRVDRPRGRDRLAHLRLVDPGNR